MKKFHAMIAISFAGSILLSGCGPLVLGAAGTGVGVIAQDRPVGQTIDDNIIRADISRKWIETNRVLYNSLNLSVHEGKVLITGRVPTQEMRLDAVRLAWQANGVREVLNEVDIADSEGIGGYARDSWILTQLRSRLAFDGEVKSVNYNLEVVGGVVYLMGIAQNQQELDRVTNHARAIADVRRVVTYVRLK
ncbi:MAG: BON domain-containing protein [Alphaproteobacteria bacterium]